MKRNDDRKRANHPSRRSFIKRGVGAAMAAAALTAIGDPLAWGQPTTAPLPQFPTPQSTRDGDMLFRTLGKTGQRVSIIGLGGAHIGGRRITEDESIRLIRYAIDHGITFMDNCWDYHNGQSEIRMGKALRDGYREKVFLMTKFDGRTKAAAARQIDESLRRLGVDHLDLIQYHEVIRDSDTDRYFAADGAGEAIAEAIKSGKARYFGITGHKDPSFFLRFLEAASKNGARVETVQMPLNVMDAHFRSFERGVLPVAIEQQIGVLAMKSLGFGSILQSRTVNAIECLHYSMNLPSATVITGMETIARVDQALEAARTFTPMTQEQVAALLERTREAAITGRFEPFKTTAGFDGTSRNPQWMG